MNGRVWLMGAFLLASSVQIWAADVTGEWQVSISTSDQTITGKASLQQTGDTVKGWVGPGENDPIPVTGTVKEKKVTIRTHPQSGRNVAFSECDLTVGDENLAGTIDSGKGKIVFTRKSRKYSEPLRWPGSSQASLKPYPPPGRLIEIGRRKLHLYCTGKGSPTVILMAGGGAFSIDWALVQPKIAENTRVCSYDRAGLAWSGPGPEDDIVGRTVSDLHALLQASGEPGPYVLVGASIAGIFIQAYQRAFPADVVSLVFTNSSNRIGFQVKDKGGLIWDLTESDIRSGFPLPSSVKKGPAPTREEAPFDKLPPDLQKVRLWLDVRLWEESDPSKAGPEPLLSWRKEFLTELDATDAGKEPPLGSLPVVVIASGPAAGESARHSRDQAGPRLDYLSSNTAHITAVGSGHEIHLYQPDRVIEGVLQAVSAVRTGKPLTQEK